MIRQLAGRLTGTAISTSRFAAAIPLGVVRSVLERVGHSDSSSSSTASDRPASSATAAAGRGDAPKAGKPADTPDEGPQVVLAVDTPPEEVEPPVDVVGEALAAERAQQAQRPAQPQPEHVEEQVEVVYSSSTDD